jgi:hypothetical protein
MVVDIPICAFTHAGVIDFDELAARDERLQHEWPGKRGVT